MQDVHTLISFLVALSAMLTFAYKLYTYNKNFKAVNLRSIIEALSNQPNHKELYERVLLTLTFNKSVTEKEITLYQRTKNQLDTFYGYIFSRDYFELSENGLIGFSKKFSSLLSYFYRLGYMTFIWFAVLIISSLWLLIIRAIFMHHSLYSDTMNSKVGFWIFLVLSPIYFFILIKDLRRYGYNFVTAIKFWNQLPETLKDKSRSYITSGTLLRSLFKRKQEPKPHF